MNEPKLQLEAGKFYRTRDGGKAYVCGRHPFDKTPNHMPFFGFVEKEGQYTVFWWHLDGTAGESVPHSTLVAEWVEPKRIKGWVATDGMFCSQISKTKLEAVKEFRRAYLGGDIIACIEIDVLEGQGLDGEAR